MNSISNYSNFSSKLRLTGLSGFDTESIVSELMKVERVPLNTLKQKRTLVEWKQAAYREVSSSLIGFKSKFFDIINRSSYLLSQSSIKAMTVKSSNSDYVTATANAQAKTGSQTIKVEQVATSAYAVSDKGVSKPVTGIVDAEKIDNMKGKRLILNLDGVTKEVTIGNDITLENFEEKLQEAIDATFGKTKSGESKIIVDYSDGELTLDTANGATKLIVYGPGADNDYFVNIADLGLTEGVSNRISLNSTLLQLQDSGLNFELNGDSVNFMINNRLFTAKSTETLEQVLARINSDAQANVQIGYDEITDKFTITSKTTGTGSSIKLYESGENGFLSFLNLGEIEPGQDAIVQIQSGSNAPETLIRSSNNFTVNGVTYTLHKAHSSESAGETLTVEQDTESVIKNIKSFVEEYNKLIDSLNGKLTESYDRSYAPLTDEEKDALSEKEIEKWENKAKTGLLRNDSILQQITLAMRKALYEKVEGVGISLKDIGIETRDYSEKGKLYLDEDKLKSALLNKPDEVTKLLNGVSTNNPSYSRDMTSEQRTDRYNKSGVFQRLSDIIEDYTSTKRNADGQKGILLEKAGIENDLSNTQNLMYEELKDYDERINELIRKLTKREENYYKKFSALETALNRMNQQSAWLMSQFGGGQ